MTVRPHVVQCRSCGADIFYAVGAKGAPMPMDAEPVVDGNLVLEPRRDRSAPRAVAFQPLIHSQAERYQSHFASCPHADHWRRR